MNILVDELPEVLTIEDIEYPINTDFSAMIILEQMLADRSLSDAQKGIEMLNIVFADELPPNTIETAKQIEWYYCCGRVMDEKRKQVIAQRGQTVKKLNSQIYDFEHDAPLIFAAFYQAYHIDLNDTYLHWWKFKALFNALPEDCEFSKAMAYRATDISKIKDKDEKKRIIRMKTFYEIPSKLTAEEKAAAIGAMF